MKHPVKKILSSMFVGCMLLSAGTMTAGAVSDVLSPSRKNGHENARKNGMNL